MKNTFYNYKGCKCPRKIVIFNFMVSNWLWNFLCGTESLLRYMKGERQPIPVFFNVMSVLEFMDGGGEGGTIENLCYKKNADNLKHPFLINTWIIRVQRLNEWLYFNILIGTNYTNMLLVFPWFLVFYRIIFNI